MNKELLEKIESIVITVVLIIGILSIMMHWS
jgi:hypothetical protein